METSSEFEKSTIANELIQGMQVAKQLKFHLSSSSLSPGYLLSLLQKILSSYDTALLLLNWPQTVPAMVALTESLISTNESGDFKDHHRDVSKKRKALPTWKDHVKICSDNGVESSADDGYSWRKYGQKDIMGAAHPRSYYRCTYRKTRTCHATKQVQRSDNDPAIFEITYRGKHTCHKAGNSVPPATPEKQERKRSGHHQQQPNDALINFGANLRVKTDDLRMKEASDTTGSSYFSVSPYQMNSFGQFSDSDYTEIISANTSTTNSPILDLDFQIDEVNLRFKFSI